MNMTGNPPKQDSIRDYALKNSKIIRVPIKSLHMNFHGISTDVMYNVTYPCDSLEVVDQSIVDQLLPTFPSIVVLSLIFVLLLIYYYVWLPINWVKDLSEVGFHHIKGASKYRGGKSKKELVEEVRRRRQLGDLPPVYPNGWFPILESQDIKAGQVKHVQALGENFAVMRSSAGEVHVLDAYCPHLGANMAVGGVVRGDCLECPFHGWQFRGEDGVCTHIPYSDKVPKTAAVKKWTSKEVNDLVFVWYHAEGDPPSWQMESIPEIESRKLRYRGRSELLVNAHLQEVLENLSDTSHFSAIHSTFVSAGSDITSYNRLINSFLKHAWTLDWKQHPAPEESHMCTLSVNHSIRLFNRFTLIPRNASTTQIGPGFALVKNDLFRTTVTFTPVEPLMTGIVFRTYCPPHLVAIAGVLLYTQSMMVERDIMVWNHKKYVANPVFVKEDDGIPRHRRWFNQFYSTNSPRYPFLRESLQW